MLKIGQIEYANCSPLFHVLRQMFPCHEYEFVTGVPSRLNRMLNSGEIDVCPSSSIIYSQYPDRFRILPGLSISSAGPVASVLLFSPVPLEKLNGRTIRLSSESATSVNLLKIVLLQMIGIECAYEEVPVGTSYDDNSSVMLLIGDAALRSAASGIARHVYDLGELWHSWTGLPFVFALWLCRNAISRSDILLSFTKQLIDAKQHVSEYLELFSGIAKEAEWMGKDRLLSYWRNNISYNLDQNAVAGLSLYFEKCLECGLIDRVPELNFVALDFD